jgi:hypothetical protein
VIADATEAGPGTLPGTLDRIASKVGVTDNDSSQPQHVCVVRRYEHREGDPVTGRGTRHDCGLIAYGSGLRRCPHRRLIAVDIHTLTDAMGRQTVS